MAGDWIKMRVHLKGDHRVLRMAEFLAVRPDFRSWLTSNHAISDDAMSNVTRNVTASLCVTGLLVTWGTARELGDRFGDDLIVTHCSYSTIDTLAGLPGFALAMESVGWLINHDAGQVMFPKFFKDNETPDEKFKRQNAERQARHRENHKAERNVTNNKKRSVTDNVTVTHEKRREQKRREEVKTLPLNPDPDSETDMRLARGMYQKIAEAVPGIKQPNFEKWANVIRLMRTVDGLDHHRIAEVFQWANRDSFWKSNILSPGKLRDKFAQLAIKKEEHANVQNGFPVRPSKSDIATQKHREYIAQLEREEANAAGGYLADSTQPAFGD